MNAPCCPASARGCFGSKGCHGPWGSVCSCRLCCGRNEDRDLGAVVSLALEDQLGMGGQQESPWSSRDVGRRRGLSRPCVQASHLRFPGIGPTETTLASGPLVLSLSVLSFLPCPLHPPHPSPACCLVSHRSHYGRSGRSSLTIHSAAHITGAQKVHPSFLRAGRAQSSQNTWSEF